MSVQKIVKNLNNLIKILLHFDISISYGNKSLIESESRCGRHGPDANNEHLKKSSYIKESIHDLSTQNK